MKLNNFKAGDKVVLDMDAPINQSTGTRLVSALEAIKATTGDLTVSSLCSVSGTIAFHDVNGRVDGRFHPLRFKLAA